MVVDDDEVHPFAQAADRARHPAQILGLGPGEDLGRGSRVILGGDRGLVGRPGPEGVDPRLPGARCEAAGDDRAVGEEADPEAAPLEDAGPAGGGEVFSRAHMWDGATVEEIEGFEKSFLAVVEHVVVGHRQCVEAGLGEGLGHLGSAADNNFSRCGAAAPGEGKLEVGEGEVRLTDDGGEAAEGPPGAFSG